MKLGLSIAIVCAVLVLAAGAVFFGPAPAATAAQENPTVKPLMVLLVSGGGFHDYEQQKAIIQEGLESRGHIEVTVEHNATPRNATNVDFDGYKGDDWAKGYDVVIHNVCSVKEEAGGFLSRVTKAHAESGTGAVFIHCAMHTCRDAQTADEWRKMLGVTTKNHEGHAPVAVTVDKPDHPVMAGHPAEVKVDKDELYRILEVWDGATVLATGVSGEKKEHPVVWTNTYGKAKVFGTTLWHYNENMQRDEYLDMVTRGVLWSAGKLNDDGTPAKGYAKQGDSKL